MRRPARPAPLLAALAALGIVTACRQEERLPGGIYRDALVTNLKTLDPVQCSDRYSYICQQQVYETLYEYKYLARPYDVQPCLAAAAPEISDSGRTYRIRVKRGVRFADDKSFPGGQGREFTAEDFVYSVKRMADVRYHTTGWWIYEGKVAGLDAFRKRSEALPPLPDSAYPALYGEPVEGISAPDKYTVQIKLNRPYPYFKYILAMPYAAVVAREAVEFYGEEFLNHPVGTGPFRLQEWRRGLRLSFVRNPAYRHGFYPAEGEPGDAAAGLLADAGKPLPFLDRIEINIFEESQPMWLNFLRGNLDRSSIPKDNYGQVVTPGKTLQGDYAAKGLRLIRGEDLDLTYVFFNMEDPVLGSHPKLRRAMSLANDVDATIRLFYNGQAVRAHGPIPPGLFGYDSAYRNPYARFDVEAARRLMAEDGFPGGQGLPEFEYLSPAGTTSRQMGEHFVQDMRRIGIRVKLAAVTWPEYLERLKRKKCQLAGAAWGADYPDPENFLQLLYGPNAAPGENVASYRNIEYDALYLEIAVMQDTPERAAKIRRMENIVAEDCPWIFNTHRLQVYMAYDRLKNHKPHAVINAPFKYYKIEGAQGR